MIMKKIIALVLVIFSVFLCVSCNNAISTDETTTTDILSLGSAIDYLSTTPPVVIPYPYLTFEEMCESATDIVVAKLKSADSYGNKHAKFTFQISETIFGNASGEIEVYVPNTPCQVTLRDGMEVYIPGTGQVKTVTFYEDSASFSRGDNLLILTQKADVYSTPSVYYAWSCATCVNLDDLELSEMYNLPLAPHVTGIDINTCTREEMIEYVRSLMQDNAPGKTLSEAQTLEDIVADAPAIFQFMAN